MAVNCSGAAQSWRVWSNLRARLTEAASEAKTPVYFLQAENDYDLTPNKVLSEIVRKAGRVATAKVYPQFGEGVKDGHAFCVRGVDIWGPEVFSFIETNNN